MLQKEEYSSITKNTQNADDLRRMQIEFDTLNSQLKASKVNAEELTQQIQDLKEELSRANKVIQDLLNENISLKSQPNDDFESDDEFLFGKSL